MDEFRDMMDWVYGPKPKKHISPTKRLMQQKEAAWKHKEFLCNNLDKGDKYSLTYVCDPKKTFVIQPREGEINYDMAAKKPVQFYKTVMKQKVTEHKVSRARTFVGKSGTNELPKKKVMKKTKTLELKSRVTIRAICRILRAVQSKLRKALEAHVDEAVTPSDLKRAMSHPETQEVV